MPQIIFEYSLDCLRTFSGIFGDIRRNVWRHFTEFWRHFTEFWQHSTECLATFHEMLGDIPGKFEDIPRNVWQHSLEMFGNIHWKCLATFIGNVWQHSLECLGAFPRIFYDIPRDVWQHSLKCLRTFPGMFGAIPQNITFPHSLCSPHSVPCPCISGFIHSPKL